MVVWLVGTVLMSLTTELLYPTLSTPHAGLIIKDKITNNEPFSLIRLGDAEVHYLNNTVPEKLQKLVCRLWNYPDHDTALQSIQTILTNALSNADMIGIMDKQNPITTKFQYRESNWSISKNFLNSINSLPYHVCDHQLPRSKEFGDINNFKSILDGNSLCIVSPNKELLNVNFSTILETNVSILIINNERERLLQQLNHIKEQVVLYGASLVGKDIGSILKQRGKTCIDFGATLDAWAGIPSRKWFSKGNLQSHCVITGNL